MNHIYPSILINEMCCQSCGTPNKNTKCQQSTDMKTLQKTQIKDDFPFDLCNALSKIFKITFIWRKESPETGFSYFFNLVLLVFLHCKMIILGTPLPLGGLKIITFLGFCMMFVVGPTLVILVSGAFSFTGISKCEFSSQISALCVF